MTQIITTHTNHSLGRTQSSSSHTTGTIFRQVSFGFSFCVDFVNITVARQYRLQRNQGWSLVFLTETVI